MTKTLGPYARRFIASYPTRIEVLATAASELKALLEDTVSPAAFDIHAIAARPKSMRSVVSKINTKGYGRPEVRFTDLVGGRVILYYEDQVDPVVDVLKARIEVDARRSVDKRRSLSLREFGYRSVHLIGALRPADQARFTSLSGVQFEVQVRSILEHAWAEIEHEVVYKRAVAFPERVRRRFAAVAGTLEVLDNQFLALRTEERELALRHLGEYKNSKGLEEEFDACRLPAFLASFYPANPGWPPAQETVPVVRGNDVASVLALRACGLSTADKLKTTLMSSGFRRALRKLAAADGIAVQQLSHFAIVLVVIGRTNFDVLNDYFPMEAANPSLKAAIA
jgi:ppGpp synthetase/RelA/SpoT-type nucleotidyltranferase